MAATSIASYTTPRDAIRSAPLEQGKEGKAPLGLPHPVQPPLRHRRVMGLPPTEASPRGLPASRAYRAPLESAGTKVSDTNGPAD